MPTELNHILQNEELVDQIMTHLISDEAGKELEKAKVDSGRLKSTVEKLAEGLEADVSLQDEAIIRKYGRPVLYIQDDKIQEPVLPLWKERLATARENLERVIPSIGRVELRGHPRYPWVGTGWLVAPRVIVTNRHVAVTFGRHTDKGFQFRFDPVGKQIRARIDFYQEYERTHESEFQVKEILHIEAEAEGRPDIAFLRVATRDQDDRELPVPVSLAENDPQPDQVVGAVGYAAWDGERNDRTVMDRIFEGVYEVKRLHPGEIMETHTLFVNHDCSTLGGNSGSVVLDFATGDAVALHYAGRYENRNYAVKASTIREKLVELNIDPEVGV
jgi:endonuclease G